MSSADPCGGATSPDDRSVCAIVCCLHICARRGLLLGSLYASTGRAHVWHVVLMWFRVSRCSTRGGVRVVGPWPPHQVGGYGWVAVVCRTRSVLIALPDREACGSVLSPGSRAKAFSFYTRSARLHGSRCRPTLSSARSTTISLSAYRHGSGLSVTIHLE